MESIDLNDIVRITLTKEGAEHINYKNTLENRTTIPKYWSKADYKEGDNFESELWWIVLYFKDAISPSYNKPFNNLTKVLHGANIQETI